MFIGKSGCIRAKWLYSGKVVGFRQGSCIWVKVVVFGETFFIGAGLLYSSKLVLLGQKWLYSGKVVVFGRNGCIWAKVVEFGQSGCIWVKVVVIG